MLTEEKLKKIEQEIAYLKLRNKKVEADKSWEASSFRAISIVVITYIIASLVLYLLGSKNFFLNALIPTIGYFLSIQSLPIIKKWWIKEKLQKNEENLNGQ